MKSKILIVDDNKSNLQILKYILLEHNYEVIISKTGLEAIQLAKQHFPDVVLLDIIMPDISGYDVCQKIKSHPENADTPIIFLTAQNDTNSLVKSFEAGGNDYISKPYSRDELLMRLKYQIDFQKSKKELKKLNALKDKYFSLITHDLKAPFANVFNLSELLLMNKDKYNSEHLHQYLELIYQSTKNGIDLLENLSQWTRSQSNRLKFNSIKISLDIIIKDIIRLFTPIVQNKKIKLAYQNSLKNNELYTDENMLNTIIRNLISNAVKYTYPEGYVKIDVSEKNDNEIEIAISDNGIGIKKEDKSKLFNQFEHFSLPGTAQESGTGLGLSLCKEFIEKNNGKIRFESEYKKGTTFFITLPK